MQYIGSIAKTRLFFEIKILQNAWAEHTRPKNSYWKAVENTSFAKMVLKGLWEYLIGQCSLEVIIMVRLKKVQTGHLIGQYERKASGWSTQTELLILQSFSLDVWLDKTDDKGLIGQSARRPSDWSEC